MTARRWFHVLLAGAFFPLLSLPVAWGVAVHWRRRAAGDEDRRWARRLLALAIVDTLVAAVAVAVLAWNARGPHTVEGPVAVVAPGDPVVIGVMPDRSHAGPGARIESVRPESPAAAAGIQPGDVIVRLGSEEVRDFDALRVMVRGCEPDVPLAVEVVRGASTLALEITPRRASAQPRGKVRLFEPAERRSCAPRLTPRDLVPAAAIAAVFVVLAVLVARRTRLPGAARGVWWTGLSAAGGGIGTLLAAAGTCAVVGGPSAGGVVLALWGSSLGLLATALVGRGLVGDAPDPAPARTWGSAVGLGAWYLVTGALRVAVLLAPVALLAPGGEAGRHPVEEVAQALGAVEGPGLLLLAIPAIVFAPVGEELAFRGLLQPALGRWLGPARGVALTAVVFAGMHWYYGFKLPLILLVGAVLGWARLATGGLRAPMVLHALVNVVGFLALPR